MKLNLKALAFSAATAALAGGEPAPAERYALLASRNVQNAGASTRVSGDVGTVHGRTVTGLEPAWVAGTIRDGGCGRAHAEALKAWRDLSGLEPTAVLPTLPEPAPHSSADLPEGLVSSWLFEEASGCRLADETGTNPLEAGSGMMLGESIGQGRCIAGNGVAGQGEARIADAAQRGLDFGTGDFALECWVKLDRPQTQVFPADAYVIGKYDAETRRGYLVSVYRHTDQTHAYLKVDLGVGWNISIDGSREFDATTRHQLLVVRENGIVTTYLDAAQDARMDVSNGESMDSTADFAVGGWPGHNSNYEGPVDTVRIWDRALTSEEIARLYALGSGEPAPAEAPDAPPALRIVPGVYACPDSLRLSGEIVLDALGDPDAEFVFQVPGDLTFVEGARVRLEGKARASQVHWAVERRVIQERATGACGTLIARDGDILLEDGSALLGRAWAPAAGVRLYNARVERP